MSYKDIWYPINEVWRICNCESEEYATILSGSVGVLSIILRFALFIIESTTSYKIDFDAYWIVVFILLGAGVFYPLTVTILYSPIGTILSLLKAIYDVLYYRIFKLGEENEKN